MTVNVKLSPAQEKFVQDCVAKGLYEDADSVVDAAMRLLRDQEQRKAVFGDMLAEIEAEIDRGEVYTADQVMAEIDEIIGAAETHAAE